VWGSDTPPLSRQFVICDLSFVIPAARLRRCRLNQQPPNNALDPLFAEAVVLQDSEGRRLVYGKTAIIQSYRDFMEIAQVLAYEEEEPDIILRPGFAVASYGWRIRYEMNGTNFDDKGRDWLALETRTALGETVELFLSPSQVQGFDQSCNLFIVGILRFHNRPRSADKTGSIVSEKDYYIEIDRPTWKRSVGNQQSDYVSLGGIPSSA
jgi:hypothetical protein